jgi:hypothetical protein
VARYTAATAAYVALRSGWGRSEAYADVTAAADDTSPLPVTLGAGPVEPAVGSRVAALIFRFLVTGRSDLAPPRHR